MYYFYCETKGRDDSGKPLWRGVVAVEDEELLGELLENEVKPILREKDPHGARIVDTWRLQGEGIMEMVEEVGFII